MPPPRRSERNAILAPSGEKSGSWSSAGPEVRRAELPATVSCTQISKLPAPARSDAKATSLPSWEIVGSVFKPGIGRQAKKRRQRCRRPTIATTRIPRPQQRHSQPGHQPENPAAAWCSARRHGGARLRQRAGFGIALQCRECYLRVIHVLETPRHIFAQAARDDLAKIRRDAPQWRRLLLKNCSAHRELRLSLETPCWPPTISYTRDPKLKMSLRASTLFPSACSGDM